MPSVDRANGAPCHELPWGIRLGCEALDAVT
jgi:hypothetical protein